MQIYRKNIVAFVLLTLTFFYVCFYFYLYMDIKNVTLEDIKKINPTIHYNYDNNLLCLACISNNNLDVIKYLCKIMDTSHTNNYGMTCISLASWHNENNIVEYLSNRHIIHIYLDYSAERIFNMINNIDPTIIHITGHHLSYKIKNLENAIKKNKTIMHVEYPNNPQYIENIKNITKHNKHLYCSQIFSTIDKYFDEIHIVPIILSYLIG